jgi:hypothetical protein
MPDYATLVPTGICRLDTFATGKRELIEIKQVARGDDAG